MPAPQLQHSVGSWQQEVPTMGLWLQLSVGPRTALLRTLDALWRSKIPGIHLGLWESLASFLLRKRLEVCPLNLICGLHSLWKFYQLAHFKQNFTEGWEGWNGWKNWINTFAYPRIRKILSHNSLFMKITWKLFLKTQKNAGHILLPSISFSWSQS